MIKKELWAVGIILFPFFICGPGARAQAVEQKPLVLFEMPEQLPRNIQDFHQRALTSYPDMTRSRVVKINFDIIERIFGKLPINARSFVGIFPRQYVNVDDGVGVGMPLLLYFRDRDEVYLTLRFNAVGHSTQNIRRCGLLRTEDGGEHWEWLVMAVCG